MNDTDIEKKVRSNPTLLLDYAYSTSVYGYEAEDDLFYEILRLHNLLTPKVLKTCGDLIERAFSSGRAYHFVKTLFEYELLEKVFPGIYALIRVDGGHYHNETVYTHVMGALRALDRIKLPWYVKLAALYHDVGKCQWEISDEGKRRFTKHATVGGPIVEKDLKRLGIPQDIIEIVKALVNLHMTQVDGPHSIRKLARALDEKNIPHKYFFWVRYADNKGSAVHKTDFRYYWRLYLKFKRTLYVKKEPSVTDLCVNGHDLMKEFHKKPGKWLGALLKYLFVGVQERGYKNERGYLITEAKKFMEWYSNN